MAVFGTSTAYHTHANTETVTSDEASTIISKVPVGLAGIPPYACGRGRQRRPHAHRVEQREYMLHRIRECVRHRSVAAFHLCDGLPERWRICWWLHSSGGRVFCHINATRATLSRVRLHPLLHATIPLVRDLLDSVRVSPPSSSIARTTPERQHAASCPVENPEMLPKIVHGRRQVHGVHLAGRIADHLCARNVPTPHYARSGRLRPSARWGLRSNSPTGKKIHARQDVQREDFPSRQSSSPRRTLRSREAVKTSLARWLVCFSRIGEVSWPRASCPGFFVAAEERQGLRRRGFSSASGLVAHVFIAARCARIRSQLARVEPTRGRDAAQ